MLDIKFIRENPELIREAARKKHLNFNVDDLIAADRERLRLIALVDELRARHHQVSDHVAKESDIDLRDKLIAQTRDLKIEKEVKETELRAVLKNWQTLMLQVPNIPDMSVPEGESEANNQEIKTWGAKPEFSFAPKSHIELMESLKMVHFEPGVKVAGFRGYFLENNGVRLSFALWQYALNFLALRGFEPVLTPVILKPEAFLGTAYLPSGAEDLYKTQDDTYLSGTAEVPVMGSYSGEKLTEAELPKKIVAWSPCFRREAGAHGKDTTGLIRVHEFFKVEQVVLCEASHETSVKQHEELLANAEALMQGLKIPYRVVINAAGDLGLGQVKKYDIEAWLPAENKYRETHSVSYFHDFQSRRLNIKYEDSAGTARFVHSLNATAIATPRILAAIVENFQTKDGSVNVPKVLQPYVGKKVLNAK